MAEINLEDFSSIFSLEGKVAVVTGGSRGLGLSAASGILQAGASKVYITSRTTDACNKACSALNAVPNKRPNAQAISVPADSSTLEGIQQLVEGVRKTTSHIDILLCNAGIVHVEEFDKHAADKFSEVLNTNVKGVFYTIQQFIPLLTAKASLENTSRVIVTSSIPGSGLALQGTYSYAVSKAGVTHLVKQLAVELGPRNILFNSISPGFFPSDMVNSLIEEAGGAEAIAKTYPNGRLGRAEDFAGVVVFLASRAGGHMTGVDITLDGGMMFGRGGRVQR